MQSVHRLFDRSVGIESVALEHVNIVELESYVRS